MNKSEVTLPIELTNGNDGRGSKWFNSAKVRKDLERTVRALGLDMASPFPEVVALTITRIVGKGQRLWDHDSIGRGNSKELIDSLVSCGWFVDDSPKYIGRVDYRQDDSQRQYGPAVKIEVEKL